MGDILKAISDDIEVYEALCKKFGEKVQYDDHGVAVYGDHAHKMRDMNRYIERCERYKERVHRHRDGSINYDGYHANALLRRERGPKPKAQPKFRPTNKRVQLTQMTIRDLELELKNSADRITSQIKSAKLFLQELQEKCKHNWESLGGFIYNEDRCRRCGKTEMY